MVEPEEQKASPGQRRHLATSLPECLALQLPIDEWTNSIACKQHLTCHPANVSKYLLCIRPSVRPETDTDEEDRAGHCSPEGHLLMQRQESKGNIQK